VSGPWGTVAGNPEMLAEVLAALPEEERQRVERRLADDAAAAGGGGGTP